MKRRRYWPFKPSWTRTKAIDPWPRCESLEIVCVRFGQRNLTFAICVQVTGLESVFLLGTMDHFCAHWVLNLAAFRSR